MSLLVKNIFRFIFLIAIIFLVLNEFQRKFNSEPGHYRLQYQEVFNKNANLDGIIIGTSHHTHSLIPGLLDTSGVRFYNFALNGSSPKFYLNWVYEILIKYHGTPKYCVLGVDWFMFDNNWVTRSFEQDSEYYPNGFFFKHLLGFNDFDKRPMLLNRFPAIKFRTTITESLKLSTGDILYPVQDFQRGFIPFYLHFDPAKHKIPKKLRVYQDQVENLEKLISCLKGLNIKVVFVMSPEFGLKPTDYDQMKSVKIIQEMSARNRIRFLNYNTEFRSEINDNPINFSDWGHMSKTGAINFSKKLALDLKSEFGSR